LISRIVVLGIVVLVAQLFEESVEDAISFPLGADEISELWPRGKQGVEHRNRDDLGEMACGSFRTPPPRPRGLPAAKLASTWRASSRNGG
jgi:hypothetical protein